MEEKITGKVMKISCSKGRLLLKLEMGEEISFPIGKRGNLESSLDLIPYQLAFQKHQVSFTKEKIGERVNYELEILNGPLGGQKYVESAHWDY